MAKSGTLSYEAVASITRAGLGQSLCIGMGGDIVAGTSLVDGLRVFEQDPDTEGIVIIGEVGGRAEEEAADWIRDYQKRVDNPKSVYRESSNNPSLIALQAHSRSSRRQDCSGWPNHGPCRCLGCTGRGYSGGKVQDPRNRRSYHGESSRELWPSYEVVVESNGQRCTKDSRFSRQCHLQLLSDSVY